MSSETVTAGDAPAMYVRAIVPAFGSKRTLAPHLVREFGSHGVYWELFGLSLAALLAKPACGMETANDLLGDAVNLARVLADEEAAIQLYARLSRTLFHETIHAEAAARIAARGWVAAPPQPDVAMAYDYMLTSWCGRNGVVGTENYNQGFCARYTANGGHGATRWRAATASIPAWHERLRNVTFLNRCAFGLLERIDDAVGTVLYLDPPYFKKDATYIHDFDSARKCKPDACDDCGGPHTHERLAYLCQRFRRARLVVSYYADPLLETLYPRSRWTHREHEVTKSLVNQGQRDRGGATKATEMLLLNGPSYVESGGLFGAGDSHAG